MKYMALTNVILYYILYHMMNERMVGGIRQKMREKKNIK